jgi:hypothetical protein
MRMYVLVRRDLKPQQQMVQAVHAAAEYCIRHPENSIEWDNHTLVVLGVNGLEELGYWMERMDDDSLIYEVFYESHYSQNTALAAIDKDGRLQKLFNRLELL